MSKRASTLPNMVLTLILITSVAGGSLGFIYQATKAPIEASAVAKQQSAIKLVVPGFDNDPAAEMYELQSAEGFTLKVFPAKRDGELIGVAIESMTNRGFSGDIKVMVGLEPDGTIINYEVLEHRETPGLGTKMYDWFKPADDDGADGEVGAVRAFFDRLFGISQDDGDDSKNILGKNPGTSTLLVKQDGGEVDAITAATITARAFLHAIEVAYTTYTQNTDAASSATTQIENWEGDEQ
ncbi:RnfABCDGE type electron transport complex subunit G [Natronoflexus pectinivorans]|uniref:Ion-translocating oxidoreductase complex subunit G n=1 Tax=Natronoflexus pectinivorans TaxID=682526 RepID=A0A4R2GIR6_9BACT|nr:RnfABCDGE type electron transport complex subunit G [Natronoflexus pectinivorans]TCO07207.1 electron transport complex protein RnfG [Natronoflexus pectinivorans]